ncbi:MAG: hypothetical protein IJ287_05875 [Methanobrevibacter sp.]|nr:hypothetical protein [Methanobrevibacter sp.]
MASVNAEDNVTSDIVSIADNASGLDVIESVDDDNLKVSPGSFTDLNGIVSNENVWTVYLDSDYAYDSSKDSSFKNGISISRSINIYGNGHTIDGKNMARIFKVDNYVNFNDINFINANADFGAALLGSNYAVNNCNFTNNYASSSGGAIQGGSATNCIFKDNSAQNLGGAIYQGSAYKCTFINNYANEGGAIYEVYTTQSTFTSNSANKQGGAMVGSSADKCTFIANYAKGYGGAVFKSYVVNCEFYNNSAVHAGAIGGDSNSALNCIFDGNSASEDGGAVYGYTVYDSTFKRNHAPNGGAMHTGSVNNCIFEENYALEAGGALMETYAVNSNFTSNTAKKGGAMYQNSAKNCIFTENVADYGGAMYNSHADNCKFYYNRAIEGGAIYDGGAEISDFRYNSATNGGAVALSSISGSTLYDNVASEYGGAGYKSSALSSLFQSNTAKFGGALSVSSSASGCKFVKNIASITGGAKYDTYTSECIFEDNSPEYVLKVSDFTGIAGFGGNIHIELYDSPKYPVTGVNATIKVYNSKNKLLGTYLSEVGYNWFVNLAAGKYKSTISVDDPAYEVDPVKVNIDILKSSFIYVENLTVNYKASKFLLINLHDSAGTVIKYAKISIKLDGTTKTYATDANGQVMIPTNTLAPGTYEVSINFVGDSTYISSSATAQIVVKKLTPKLTADKKTFKLKDKTKKYVVTLKNNKGKVMKSTKVKITVNGKTYSAKTNTKGQATFKLTKLTKKGTFTAVVAYDGSSIYNSVQKTVKIVVKK